MIDCEITNEISDFILEPLDEFPVVEIPSRSFNKSGTRDKLCLINITPRAHFFRQGQPLATAAPATKVGILEASVRQVRTESSSEIPTHIKELLDESVRLITQYSDVFAVCDVDLGEFTAIEHQIQAPKSQGRKRRGGKRKRYKYCVCKTKTPVGLMVQCDQCKDWFDPICVGRGR